MSENKKIYCTQCGSENSAESKFCSNCGSKLEQLAAINKEEQPSAVRSEEIPARTEGIFSGEETASAYEKITDVEEEKPAAIPSYQEEIKINYSSDPQTFNAGSNAYGAGNNQNVYYTSSNTQYYSNDNQENINNQGGGNIGFAIASLVCGILSMVCCCLTLFSALLAIAAVVLGVITLCFKYDGKGLAIAGIITGGLGLLIVIFAMLLGGSSFYSEFLNEFDDFYY